MKIKIFSKLFYLRIKKKHFKASGCCSSAHKAHTNGFSASELSVQPTGGGSGTRLVEPTYVLYCQCDKLVYSQHPSGAAPHLDSFWLFWNRKKCFKCLTMLPKWQPLNQFWFVWYNWAGVEAGSTDFRLVFDLEHLAGSPLPCWSKGVGPYDIALPLNMPFSHTELL